MNHDWWVFKYYPDERRRSWGIGFSWWREHFLVDRHDRGWERYNVRRFIVQTFSALPNRLPFQAAASQVRDHVFPSQCWSVRKYMPRHIAGIFVPSEFQIIAECLYRFQSWTCCCKLILIKSILFSLRCVYIGQVVFRLWLQDDSSVHSESFRRSDCCFFFRRANRVFSSI